MQASATPFHVACDQPPWFPAWFAAQPTHVSTVEDRMRLVNDAARRNFELGTGGPFAAAVFESVSGKLVAVGVNRVLATGYTSAHAEVICLSLAQAAVGKYDLGAPGDPVRQIVVNWRPCQMCLGSVLWSGVREMVLAGEGPELEALTGFDEGVVAHDWQV